MFSLKLFNAHVLRTWFITLFCAASAIGSSQVDVLTQHNDNFRSGNYLSETILNTSNVNVSNFGLLFTRKVDAYLTAQILYKANVMVGGHLHNVIYVATNNDSVYCYDADDPSATAPLWKTSFINPPSITAVPKKDVEGGTYTATIGIRSTPVIDSSTNTLYCVAYTLEGDPALDSSFHLKLHALDITTGNERAGSPAEISGRVPGKGDGTDGTYVVFNAHRENQRPALLLSNGNIYIASAGHADIRPYHGWVFAYSASTLTQTAVHCVTPNSYMGGIWMSGQGMASDSQGNVYYMSGNGIFTADPSLNSGQDYGNSIVKLSPSLSVLDFFTPYNQAELQANDWDLGSSGTLLIPNTSLIVGGGKQGFLYLTNTSNMGRYNTGGTDSQVVQKWSVSSGELMGAPIFWYGPDGGHLFVNGSGESVNSYPFTGSYFGTTPLKGTDSTGTIIHSDPNSYGNQLSLSSYKNAAGTGILWVAMEGPSFTTLRAFDAVTMKEIWNSEMNSARDRQGSWAKFNTPTVAAGKVYEPTNSGYLYVYGLLNGPPAIPAPPTNVSATGRATSIALTWSPSSGATTYTVLRSTTPGKGYAVVRAKVTTTAFNDSEVTLKARYYYVITASNSKGTSGNSLEVNAVSGSGSPAAPTNLTATPGATSATLNWTASSGATSYTVMRSLTSGGGYANVQTGLSGTTYVDNGLTPHTPYYYVVSASNSTGTSPNSTEVRCVPGGTSTTLTLLPVADTYTHSSPSESDTNLGSGHFLRTKYVSANEQRRIYLKFDLSRVQGTITSAKLMLYGFHSGPATATDYVYGVADNAWTESGITWNNQPAIGSPLNSTTVGTSLQYWTWDVSSFVNKPGGNVSLALQMNSPPSDQYSNEYHSKENQNSFPQLVLTVVN